MNQLTYLIYLVLAILLVLYMGNVCVHNGKVYIANFFPNRVAFANAINSSLKIAYYCLNIGLAIWSLSSIHQITSYPHMIEEIASRLSNIILLLTLLHFINLTAIYLLFNKQKK